MITFTGESSRFNINFEKTDVLSTVYKKVRAIEISRQSLIQKNFSSEDLNPNSSRKRSNTEERCQQPSTVPIIAEIDMVNSNLRNSEGTKHRKVYRVHNRSFSHQKRPRAPEEGKSMCNIF